MKMLKRNGLEHGRAFCGVLRTSVVSRLGCAAAELTGGPEDGLKTP